MNLRPCLLLGVLAGAFVLGGCASSVSRANPAVPTTYRLSATQKASAVTIKLTAAAREKVKDNLKFDQEELRKHVERAFDAYAVLDATRKDELPVVEVEVTSVRVRSNFSAVAFGFMAGGDNISGDIVIRDHTGRELDRFHVSATYALGGLAGGMDDARMGWLYEAFAKQAVQEVTGVKKP